MHLKKDCLSNCQWLREETFEYWAGLVLEPFQVRWLHKEEYYRFEGKRGTFYYEGTIGISWVSLMGDVLQVKDHSEKSTEELMISIDSWIRNRSGYGMEAAMTDFELCFYAGVSSVFVKNVKAAFLVELLRRGASIESLKHVSNVNQLNI